MDCPLVAGLVQRPLSSGRIGYFGEAFALNLSYLGGL